MSITINSSDKYNDYFTFNDGVKDYQWHGRKGAQQDSATLLLLIRNREYPDANCTTLEAMEQWLTDNPEVQPIPWKSTHPVKQKLKDRLGIDQDYIDEIMTCSTLDELKAAFVALFDREVL